MLIRGYSFANDHPHHLFCHRLIFNVIQKNIETNLVFWNSAFTLETRRDVPHIFPRYHVPACDLRIATDHPAEHGTGGYIKIFCQRHRNFRQNPDRCFGNSKQKQRYQSIPNLFVLGDQCTGNNIAKPGNKYHIFLYIVYRRLYLVNK